MPEATALAKRAKILVVDDDLSVLECLKRALAADFQVITASNGTGALEQASKTEGTIDLLVTDFEMPGINGIELATQLTALRPQIKVLLMSGFQGGMLVLNDGWHYLPKPFIASHLIKLIINLISPAESRFTAAAIAGHSTD
jgi:DNA-binding NtrC family response regulator